MLAGSKPIVAVLLGTYNGSRYVNDQIESIIRQTHDNWRLIIRDDGSSDNTRALCIEHSRRDSRITVLESDGDKNLGSARNFGKLLATATNFQYIMFCDQDDVWLPNKIEITLDEMLCAESQKTKEYPVLVYSNFIYVNERLEIIQSMAGFSATKVKKLEFNHLLVQNPVYGCTMMINRSLALMAIPVPDTAENHDYWVALVASAFGDIRYLNIGLLYYRQHGNNVSGNYDNNSFIKRVKRILVRQDSLKDVASKYKMSLEFKKRFSSVLNTEKVRVLDSFIYFVETKKKKYLIECIKSGIRRQTFSQTLLLYFSIIFVKKIGR